MNKVEFPKPNSMHLHKTCLFYHISLFNTADEPSYSQLKLNLTVGKCKLLTLIQTKQVIYIWEVFTICYLYLWWFCHFLTKCRAVLPHIRCLERNPLCLSTICHIYLSFCQKLAHFQLESTNSFFCFCFSCTCSVSETDLIYRSILLGRGEVSHSTLLCKS